MIEITEKSEKYAIGKANAAIEKAIAQAYADGYRDGYKDREEEIPVDFRNDKTIYVDLGLPSGTLWSANYEKEGDDVMYVPYDKAVVYDIPTIEQWNELFATCKWEYVVNSIGVLYRIDCTGSNGQVLSFYPSGLINAKQKNKKYDVFFWTKEDTEGNEKRAVHMYQEYVTIQNKKYPQDYRLVENTFSGFKLPIRLVKKK